MVKGCLGCLGALVLWAAWIAVVMGLCFAAIFLGAGTVFWRHPGEYVQSALNRTVRTGTVDGQRWELHASLQPNGAVCLGEATRVARPGGGTRLRKVTHNVCGWVPVTGGTGWVGDGPGVHTIEGTDSWLYYGSAPATAARVRISFKTGTVDGGTATVPTFRHRGYRARFYVVERPFWAQMSSLDMYDDHGRRLDVL